MFKFPSSDIHEKEFAAALRRNVVAYFTVRKLSTKGNYPMVVQSVTMLALYIAPFVLLFTVQMNVWLALLLFVIMGIGMAGIGMCVMHDAVHGSYSSIDWLKKVLGGTLYLLGSNVFNWKIQHNVLHHAYTNIEVLKQVIASKGPIRLSENAPLKKFHHYHYIHAFFFYGLMTISKFTKDFTQLVGFTKAGITRQHQVNPTIEYAKMVMVKVAYLFVFIGLPIIFTPFSWCQVVIGFFIMHWTCGCILSTIFKMAYVVEGAEQPMPNKEGVVETEWAVHELQTTFDFARNNLFLNYYAGGFNFQIEHHLFPNICHIPYHKIAPVVEKTA